MSLLPQSPPLLLLLLTVCCYVQPTQAINLFAFRKEGRWICEGRRWYFLLNTTKYEWPEKYTMFCYNFNAYFFLGKTEYSGLRGPEWLNSTETAKVVNVGTLDSMWNGHTNAALAVNSTLVKETHRVSGASNVGLIYRPHFRDWVIAYGNKLVQAPAVNATSVGRNLKGFASWVLAMEGNLSSNPQEVNVLSFDTRDPRMLATRDGRYFLVSNRYQGRRIIATYEEIQTNSSSSPPRLHVDGAVLVGGAYDEKNWTPFDYRDQLYFLSSVWPFQVVHVDVNTSASWSGQARTISTFPLDYPSCYQWPWSIGKDLIFRGGTQAVPISSTTFLSIFHSFSSVSPQDDNGAMKTYTMGAFTFEAVDGNSSNGSSGSAAAPPVGEEGSSPTHPSFRLTAISRSPISHNSWYSGPWVHNPNAFGMFDYVVFPMSIMVEGGDVLIVFGRQDQTTWISRLALGELLGSLVPIAANGTCLSTAAALPPRLLPRRE